MNRDQMEGNWKQLKGRIKEKWGDLTDDELDRTEGRREQISGLLQERYGMGREDAERELDDYFDRH
jgi:uncharacterized protein YjbJ (UPF0337 family)